MGVREAPRELRVDQLVAHDPRGRDLVRHPDPNRREDEHEHDQRGGQYPCLRDPFGPARGSSLRLLYRLSHLAEATTSPSSGGFRFLELLLQQRDPLGEQQVALGELRDRGRVVKQHDEDEDGREQEERRRRVGDPDRLREHVQPVAPHREDEQHDAGHQPQQRVTLLEAAAADQLEDDDQQENRGDGREDGDANWGHCSSAGAG